MLIKLTDGSYVDHRTIIMVKKTETDYSGSTKTAYKIEVLVSNGSYDASLILRYDSCAKRDRAFIALIEKVNTELNKDREALRGADRFSLVGLNKEKQDD